ncbi:helix-turn-helix domain-containing protein [Actinospica sp. MGRD01-02]|uniref:Helix-turn-helix domain-containing protein n=1 Tax=Actinospica acidithermotolerans TaxID=2828514 RepID=A0A941IJI9_9ACTN|nr:XRE family transcriptional regulator [Actinospica acidithermotolerans]MBR7829514.1 helix-turn-helix domain-containing protein [Actinospica acidithermotolerans]
MRTGRSDGAPRASGAELAHELRRMRDLSGCSLKELERSTYVSDSSLSRYLAGRQLAPWSVVVALCRVVGRDPVELLALWEQASADLRPEPGTGVDGRVDAGMVAGMDAGTARRNELPRVPAHLVGRELEAAALRETLLGSRLACIDGMGGVGKTALALHVAHGLVSQFPDGQLYLDLHGYTDGREPVGADEALAILLRAVGVMSHDFPRGTEEAAARWRGEIASRRVLLVIDNAVDAAQVAPLLPGSGGSATIVVSRHRLVEIEAAHALSLDTLSDDAARELFAKAVGDDRPLREAEATTSVVRSCGALPLALKIAGGRLRRRPMWTVTALADRLSERDQRAAELTAGNVSVDAVFAMSCRHVPAAQQAMLRVLAGLPIGRFDPYVAAAAADLPAAVARSQLDSLVDAHLLQEQQVEVYTLHDLVAAFARRLAEREDGPAAMTDRVDRMLSYYRECLLSIARDLGKPERPLPAGPQPFPADLPDLSGARAVPWLAEHLDAILLAVRTARGSDDRIYSLAQAMTVFMHSYTGGGTVQARIDADAAGLQSARRAGDLDAESWLTGDLGLAQHDAGRTHVARELLPRAIELAEQADNLYAQAFWNALTAHLHEEDGRPDLGIEALERSIALYREAGYDYGAARMSGYLGDALVGAGRVDEGIGEIESAIATMRADKSRDGELYQQGNLGNAYLVAGRHDEAAEALYRCLTLSRELSVRYMEAFALNGLARTFRAVGDEEQGRALHAEAMELITRIGDRSQEQAFRTAFDDARRRE